MPQPTAFAFGGSQTSIVDAQGKPVTGTFATCPESDEEFMGPTLWASDLRIFGLPKTQREPPFNGPDTGKEGPGSHIDMLHRSPECTGIAWEGTGNVYWTYSAKYSRFVRYDFAKDHGIGNEDHSDGSVWRYAVAGIGYVPGVPSHLEYRQENHLLYMADTGHGRVVSFDPESAKQRVAMSENENVDGLQVAWDMQGGSVVELVGAGSGMKKPSGIEIHAGAIYVSDNETSTVYKYSLTGMKLASVVIAGVKPGALAGLTFGPDQKLYLVDQVDNRVLRLDSAF